jgi:hypothetical protein
MPYFIKDNPKISELQEGSRSGMENGMQNGEFGARGRL